MKKIHLSTGVMVLFFTAFLLMSPKGWTQNDPSSAGTRALFSNLPRPEPDFDHERHEEAFEEGGCARCHHVEDDNGELVYEEDEEAACVDCHARREEDDIPAIREASHRQCTGCHRSMKKKRLAAGPTTCGECHAK